MGGSEAPTVSLTCWRVMPELKPSVKRATRVVSNSAMSGSPMKSRLSRSGVPALRKMSTRALPIIRTTGSRTVARVIAKLG